MPIYQESIIQVTETHTERSRSEAEGTGERSRIAWSRHFGTSTPLTVTSDFGCSKTTYLPQLNKILTYFHFIQ